MRVIAIDDADYFRFPTSIDVCARRPSRRPEILLTGGDTSSSTNHLHCVYTPRVICYVTIHSSDKAVIRPASVLLRCQVPSKSGGVG